MVVWNRIFLGFCDADVKQISQDVWVEVLKKWHKVPRKTEWFWEKKNKSKISLRRFERGNYFERRKNGSWRLTFKYQDDLMCLNKIDIFLLVILFSQKIELCKDIFPKTFVKSSIQHEQKIWEKRDFCLNPTPG